MDKSQSAVPKEISEGQSRIAFPPPSTQKQGARERSPKRGMIRGSASYTLLWGWRAFIPTSKAGEGAAAQGG